MLYIRMKQNQGYYTLYVYYIERKNIPFYNIKLELYTVSIKNEKQFGFLTNADNTK